MSGGTSTCNVCTSMPGRMQRADLYTERNVRMRVDQRGDPEDRKQRDRKNPGLDEDALKTTHQEALGDAPLARPGQPVDDLSHATGEDRIVHERHSPAV